MHMYKLAFFVVYYYTWPLIKVAACIAAKTFGSKSNC